MRMLWLKGSLPEISWWWGSPFRCNNMYVVVRSCWSRSWRVFFFFFFFLNKVYRIGLTISSVWVLFTAEGGNSFFRSKSLQALWRAVMSLSQPQLQTWLFGLSRWLAATSSSPLTTNITGTMWMHLLSLSLCMEVQLHVYDRWACTHAKWECRPPLKGFLWCWLLPSIARFLLHDDSLARFDELGFLAMQ